jgi:polyphenol oxidase
MINEFVNGKVYYKIFDKSYKKSDNLYAKNAEKAATKITEITQNFKVVCEELFGTDILTLNQVHGNTIIDGDTLSDTNVQPIGDGVITTKTNLIIGVQTADCVPLLLSSLDGKVIGAAHCGWRSAKSDIIANIVRVMQDKGAYKLKAVIGPSIQQHSYEVDEKYRDDFIKDNKGYSRFFIESPKSERYMFDLPSFVEHKLKESNISNILNIREDTYTNPDKYPSYRRSMHLGEACVDRILSTIIIR